MPRQPRPIAPVFQPEVVARAIVGAALSPRRELWLGLSTVKVILGSMLAPAFLDRYLARHAVDGQEKSATVAPDRRDNLIKPVRNLHATHGVFGNEARMNAALLSGELARLWAGLLGLGGLLLAAGLVLRQGGVCSRIRRRRR